MPDPGPMGPTADPTLVTPEVKPPEPDDLDALVIRARSGDAAILPQLRAFLDEHPAAWRHCGDLALQAQEAWINLIAGPDLLARESLSRQTAALRAELAGPAPSSLEKLLVARIVACWLQVHYSDASVAESAALSLRQASFAQKRQDAAHRRYMAALGGLALVRRLVPGSHVPVAAPAQENTPVPPAGRDGTNGVEPDPRVSLALFNPPAPLGSSSPLGRQHGTLPGMVPGAGESPLTHGRRP